VASSKMEALLPLYNDEVESMKNVSTVATEVKKHLINVYTSLLLTTLFSCLGVAFFSFTFFPPLISMIIAIGLILAITLKPEVTEQNKNEGITLRMALLLGYGFFQGASIGGLVYVVMIMDPNIVLTAFLGTVTIFGCLTGSALLAKRKTYLFMGGFLASALMNLFLLGIVNIFLRLEVLDIVVLYFSLFIFCGYVLYDTQIIIEKVNLGSRDFVRHAAELFTDFVGIFVRILIILARNKRSNR